MNWTSGYVADLGYTAGFYRETAPSHGIAALITPQLDTPSIPSVSSNSAPARVSPRRLPNPHIALKVTINPEHGEYEALDRRWRPGQRHGLGNQF
jgi:hypothetical protein